MPFSTELIDPAVDRYRRERDRYIKLADRIAEICRTDICEKNAIRAQITFRAKTVQSFKGKLQRFARLEYKNFASEDDIFAEISDLAGVRIAAYRTEDCAAIVKEIQSVFCGADGGNVPIDDKDRSKQDAHNFYRATHAQAYLREDELRGTYDNLDDVSCEIQVCTMMAHVWNEIEHDIGYKPDGGQPSDYEKFLLKDLGSKVRGGDETITELLAANEKRLNEGAVEAGVEFEDVHDFVARMRREYDVSDFARNSGQLFDQLGPLGLSSPAKLAETLGDKPDLGAVREAVETFNEILGNQESSALRMDPESSDVLLIRLLETMHSQIIESHRGRVGRGRGRPTRLYSLAKRYEDSNRRNPTAGGTQIL